MEWSVNQVAASKKQRSRVVTAERKMIVPLINCQTLIFCFFIDTFC